MAQSMSSSGTEAGRPQPQTTVEPSGGPFIRHSQPGRRTQYALSSQPFGQVITQPLVQVPGYISKYRLQFQTSGGAGANAILSADAPYDLVSLVTMKDAFGTPLIVAPGYTALKLIPMYGGGFGMGLQRDPANLPGWAGSDSSGNFTFQSALPLEFTKGYGLISGANASLLPNLQFNLNTASGVYSTIPSTVPVINMTVDSDFYWLPEGVNIEPPGIGTTRQYVYQQATPGIGSNSTVSVQFPRMGGYLDCIIIEMRDSTGARIDAWPQRLRLYVDGVQLVDSAITDIFNDMAIQFQGVTRPVGVIAISRKTALSNWDMGLFDTGEQYLSTNPGTLIEIQGAPWGAITNAPATLNVTVGQVVPSGTLIQGLPEL